MKKAGIALMFVFCLLASIPIAQAAKSDLIYTLEATTPDGDSSYTSSGAERLAPLGEDATRQEVQNYIKEALNSNAGLNSDTKIQGRKRNEDGTYKVAIAYKGMAGTANLIVTVDPEGVVTDANTDMSDEELQAEYDKIVYGGGNEMTVQDIITVNDVLHAESGAFLSEVANELGITEDTAAGTAASAASLAGVVILGAGKTTEEKRKILVDAIIKKNKEARHAAGGEVGGELTGSTGNTDYDAWIKEYAAESDVPTNLLYCLLNQESGFDARTVSKSGAIGIAQFMPTTAASLGIDPYDPKQSIQGAARLLRQLYDKFGSWELSLAAYNAGENAVEQYGGMPPYEETETYVNTIMTAYEGMNKPAPVDDYENSLGALVDKGIKAVSGRTSPYGSLGCADTVALVGSYYNTDLKEEYDNGVVSVPVLRADLEAKGYSCEAFNGYAKKGDLLIYGDDDHVVVADGGGGCFGNSSSLCVAKYYFDVANAWQTGELPTKIIHMS